VYQVFYSMARDMSFVSLLFLIIIRSSVPGDHGFSVNHADYQTEGPQVSKKDSTTTMPFFAKYRITYVSCTPFALNSCSLLAKTTEPVLNALLQETTAS